MSEQQKAMTFPVEVVHYGMGKEIQLYSDELVVVSREEAKEFHVALKSIERLILTPGDPIPSKLILLGELTDGSTTVLVDGMTNARDFRKMLPQLLQLQPELQLDPSDMDEQLRQALNNRRAWNLTCYGAIILICILLYVLYLLVTFIGMHR